MSKCRKCAALFFVQSMLELISDTVACAVFYLLCLRLWQSDTVAFRVRDLRTDFLFCGEGIRPSTNWSGCGNACFGEDRSDSSSLRQL